MDVDNKYMESTIDHVIMGKPRLQTSDGGVEIANWIALVREGVEVTQRFKSRCV